MTSLNVSLPASMRSWIDQQVKQGGYGTASEFVRELVRDAKRNRAKNELHRKLIEGIESGPGTPMTEADWKGLRRRAVQRAAKRKAR